MTAYSRAYTNNTSTKGEGKKKTVESRTKEIVSRLKTTSNEFVKSLFTRKPARKWSWALTIWIPGRIQMKRFIPVESFPFEVFPFSRFYRNSRKFLYHLPLLQCQALHGNTSEKECLRSERWRQISKTFIVTMCVFGGRFRAQLQPCRWKRIKLFGRYLCFSFTCVIQESVLQPELHRGRNVDADC